MRWWRRRSKTRKEVEQSHERSKEAVYVDAKQREIESRLRALRARAEVGKLEGREE